MSLIAVLVVYTSTISLAQTGTLSINIYYYSNNNYEVPNLKLFLNDSLVGSQDYDDYETKFTSLIEGKYKLTADDKDGHSTSYDWIEVSNDSTTTIYLYGWNYEKECDSCEVKNDGLVEADFGILYAEPLSQDYTLVNSSLSVYYGMSSWIGKGKFLDIGGCVGYYYEQTSLDTSVSFSGISHSKQRYMNTGIRLEAKGRVAFFEHRNYGTHGVVLDYGVAYLVPILFRRVIKTDEFRAADSRIHNYKDFRPFVRVGYTPFTISLEHRLVNFIKDDDLPQLPKWSLGVHLLFNP